MRFRGIALAVGLACSSVVAAEPSPVRPVPLPATVGSVPDTKPLPINLPTALRLGGASPLDIAIAAERLQAAAAQYDKARVMWLPNLNLGVDYFRHDGQLQDIVGFVFPTNKSAFLVGGGPTLTVGVTDAVYAPLARKQLVKARQADLETARNDTTLAVAEAYFAVQQARGEVAGAVDAARRADELVARTTKLAPALAPTVEITRARTELAHRRVVVETAYERWQLASADLARILRLDPSAVVEPAEDPHLRVTLVDPVSGFEDLIPVALTNRPELAAHQALVQATIVRVRQEKMRPLLPNLALRGGAGGTSGLSSGYFGGGLDANVSKFGGRNTMDVSAVWTFDNLGLGNRAAVREREAEGRVAMLELLRTQDRIAAEVSQSLAETKRSATRVTEAEAGVRDAVETAEKNLTGLGQTKRVGEQLLLVFRPQEAVASVAALEQAYRDYYAAVAASNRAQFRLYRALGHPAQGLNLTPSAP